jgi:DNA polymerase III subunit gamma/tau
MAKAKSEYTVVARRYRPQQFDDLLGQEAVAQALRNALTSDRVAHAYLFAGPRGVGKTSAARILAKALNCVKGATPTPCDKCTSCLAIAEGDDIDVREIDGASNRQIDDIRGIRQDVATRPTRGRYKIYIIDEVHMLTRDAFNALLKTLEEPPPHVKFIFATTEVQKVPLTIISRCQRFDFASIGAENIAEQLKTIVKTEKRAAEDEALEIIARRAGGSMRDAQSLLEQLLAFSGDKLTAKSIEHLLGIAGPEVVMALSESIVGRDAKTAIEQLGAFVQSGHQPAELLDQLIEHWRDLMLVAAAGESASDLNTPSRFRETLSRQSATLGLDTIMAGLDILVLTKNRLRGSGHILTLLQMALIRLCRLEDLAPLSQLALWLSQPGAAALPASGSSSGSRLAAGNSGRLPILPPEAKKNSENNAKTSELTPETLPEIWSEVISQMGLMLGGQLQRIGLPAIIGPNSLVLSFGPDYNAAYEHCSSGANLQRLESFVRSRTGKPWTVKLEKTGVPVNGTAAKVGSNGHASIVKARPQDVMQEFPILQRAIEVFEALPMFVDSGFGSAPPKGSATNSPPAPDNEDREA